MCRVTCPASGDQIALPRQAWPPDMMDQMEDTVDADLQLRNSATGSSLILVGVTGSPVFVDQDSRQVCSPLMGSASPTPCHSLLLAQSLTGHFRSDFKKNDSASKLL